MEKNPWKLGQEHIAPDGTKLIVCDCERDGSGCKVCDGCWYLRNKQHKCPECRGPIVFMDYDWGVTFQTKEQIEEDKKRRERERRNYASVAYWDNPKDYW